jgi:hypothetical protein
MACRPQPYRLDPPHEGSGALKQVVTNADEMFQILFEDIAALCAEVDSLRADLTACCVSMTAASSRVMFFPGHDGNDGEPGMVGPPGPPGDSIVGPPGMPGMDGESADPVFWPPGS